MCVSSMMMPLMTSHFSNLFFYLVLSGLLFLAMLAYIWLARHYQILDYPNARSSHATPTISGAGILFPVAFLLWFLLFGQQYVMVFIALLALSTLSFIDDLKHVNAKPRVFVQVIAAVLLLYASGAFQQQWYIVILAFLLVFGYVNAGNFMDGINGMTALSQMVSLGSLVFLEYFLPVILPQAPSGVFPEGLLPVMLISLLVFAVFNARKNALVFAGDVGSISISFIVAWMLILLILATNMYYWLLFIAIYGIDTAYTMTVRLRHRQKPLEAHRTHLHHLLVDIKGYPHLNVSAAYAGAQLLVNALVVWMIATGSMKLFWFLMFWFILIGTYAFFRRRVFYEQEAKA